MFKIKKHSAVIFLILFFGLIWQMAGILPASALGQMTEPIVIKNALRGESATAVLTVLNTEDKEIKVELKAEGQIASWANFYEISDKKMANPVNQITLPVKSYQDAAVKFEIPKDAANGVYKGVLAVLTIPETTNTTDQSKTNISQRVDRQVTIAVMGEEMVVFDASVIPQTYDLSEKEALKIRIIYDNQGNVSINPQVQVKIKKEGETVYNAIFPYPEGEALVKPGSQQEIAVLEIPTSNLAQGKYLAELDFLYNGQTKLEKDFKFSIGLVTAKDKNAGNFYGKFWAAVISFGISIPPIVWYGVGGLILVVGVGRILISRKKTAKNSNT